MMNRKNMTASTLSETELNAYYTLAEGSGCFGLGLALAAALNSRKKQKPSRTRIDEDTLAAGKLH